MYTYHTMGVNGPGVSASRLNGAFDFLKDLDVDGDGIIEAAPLNEGGDDALGSIEQLLDDPDLSGGQKRVLVEVRHALQAPGQYGVNPDARSNTLNKYQKIIKKMGFAYVPDDEKKQTPAERELKSLIDDGNQAYANSRPDRAVVLWEQALERAPNDPRLLQKLNRAKKTIRNRALLLAGKSIHEPPLWAGSSKDVQNLWSAGNKAYSNGQLYAAQSLYAQALALEPENIDLQNVLARCKRAFSFVQRLQIAQRP